MNKIINMAFNDLFFVNMVILFLFNKKFVTKAKNIKYGRLALMDKKMLLMLILFLSINIFSKLVSIQNQIEKKRSIYI